MPMLQNLISTVRVMYRNSYTDTQLVEWMDEVQKQIFQTVRHEAVPWYFTTVDGFSFYPLPSDCDPMGVKQVDIETKTGSNKFRQLRFINIESTEQVSPFNEFYSIQANQNIYLNPVPTDKSEGRQVIVYYNKKPATLSISDLTVVPDLEENFQELLILGCVERVARARGEYEDKNMFAADFEKLFRRYKALYDQPFPEYKTPSDVMPRHRGRVSVKGYGQKYPYGLLPSDLI